MEIAKEQIFLQLKMDPVLQTQGKDISTRLWHASLAFSPLRAVACKRLLFHKYKLSFLCHPNPHFTLSVMWAHWTHERHMRTNKFPRVEVFERLCVYVCVCLHVSGVNVVYVDIRYEELTLIIVSNQVKGVYSSREPWPPCLFSKICQYHVAQRLDMLNLSDKI